MLLKSIKYNFQVVLNQLVIFKKLLLIVFVTVFAACSSARLHKVKRQIEAELEDNRFSAQFTGLLVIDSQTNDTIVAKNSDKYFIPASTVKLFTLYAANTLLNDKIPSLNYIESNDSLYIKGTGDPTWLHPYFKDSTALSFLKKTAKSVVLYLDNFKDGPFGPGWAWEDYHYYFSPELGPMPLYGNVVTIYEGETLDVSPSDFAKHVKRSKPTKPRALHKNEFTIPKFLKDTLQIPFITSPELTKKFLQKSLKREIYLSKNPSNEPYEVLYGISTDSLYKRMLYESDNFIAEQLMLVASSSLSDSLSFKNTRNFILDNHLSNLRQEPRWVDGSGLSRYNLFTPESMVSVLHKLYAEIDTQRLFDLLPAWNSNGTVKKPNSTTEYFIFAKSGSMGNTYNLSGYLKTKSGRIFIFSFMNNHFRIPSKEIRLQIEKTLISLHDAY